MASRATKPSSPGASPATGKTNREDSTRIAIYASASGSAVGPVRGILVELRKADKNASCGPILRKPIRRMSVRASLTMRIKCRCRHAQALPEVGGGQYATVQLSNNVPSHETIIHHDICCFLIYSKLLSSRCETIDEMIYETIPPMVSKRLAESSAHGNAVVRVRRSPCSDGRRQENQKNPEEP